MYRALEGSETYCNAICPAYSISITEIEDGDDMDEDLVIMEKRFHYFSAKRVKTIRVDIRSLN